MTNLVSSHNRFQTITHYSRLHGHPIKNFADAQGFDCSFVNGQKDIDLCQRIRKKPYQHYWVNHE